jgi:GDPmannose 4,6-dehydratase
MESKRCLITGVTGQDGSYLAELLLGKGYEVYGLVRRLSSPNLKNIQTLVDNESITLIGGDLADQSSIASAINISRPDEIFNLAAQSFVGESWNQAEYTTNITGLGALRVYETVRHINKDIRIYQASSSEMYGNVNGVLNEMTVMHPRSPYGVAKLMAHETGRVYRESYQMWISCGILFNHESPRRGIEFISQKIANGVARIKFGLDKKLKLGNIRAKRDFGYSRDYVKAMWSMLNDVDKSEDFVISTGESHSVGELCQIAFEYAGLGNWELYVEFDKGLERPAEIHDLVGDCSKAREKFGWRSKTSFRDLVKIMVDAQLKELNRL